MIRSPDLRIVARRSNLSGSGSEDRAQWRVRVAPKTASLPAYSGGTVWDLHPLPLLIEQRRIDTSVYLRTRAPSYGIIGTDARAAGDEWASRGRVET